MFTGEKNKTPVVSVDGKKFTAPHILIATGCTYFNPIFTPQPTYFTYLYIIHQVILCFVMRLKIGNLKFKCPVIFVILINKIYIYLQPACKKWSVIACKTIRVIATSHIFTWQKAIFVWVCL